MRTIVFAGLILERSALVTGFAAAAIAVGGFVARSHALFANVSNLKVQRYTTSGGVFGLFLSLLVTLLDALTG
jgi:hypothetical protein